MKKVVVGIISKDGKYLLVKSKKDFGKYTGFYYPPGGHLEKNEGEEEALKRELKEELNLEIQTVNKIAETTSDIADQITFWWKVVVISGEMRIANELLAADYFDKEEIENLNLWPATKDFFKKYIFNH